MAHLPPDPLKYRHPVSLAFPFLLPVLLLTLRSAAQLRDYSTKDKKAIKLYEEGLDCTHQRDWNCAEARLSKAAGFDDHFVEPRFALAEPVRPAGQRHRGHALVPRGPAAGPALLPERLPAPGRHRVPEPGVHRRRGALQDLPGPEPGPVRADRARLGIDNCTFAARAIKQPVPFEPVNLGPGVNSAEPEYYPCVTADDRTSIYTRRVTAPRCGPTACRRIFVSHRGEDGSWGRSDPVPTVNTLHHNEGRHAHAGRALHHLHQVRTGRWQLRRRIEGPGQLRPLHQPAHRRPMDQAREPGPAGELGRNWESQPSMASDGRTSTSCGGRWPATASAIWTSGAAPCRTTVRSAPGEAAGRGEHPSRRRACDPPPTGARSTSAATAIPASGAGHLHEPEGGGWQLGQALNLGWPINTGDDENSLLVSADGRVAYFASDREGGQGDLDLYSFELYPEARPEPVTYIRGRVYDEATGEPLEADVMLLDPDGRAPCHGRLQHPGTGEFLVVLPTERTYALNASAEGYLFFSANYDVQGTGDNADPFTLEVPMRPLKTGETIALRNVFFETASHELLPASHVELDRLVQLLSATPRCGSRSGPHGQRRRGGREPTAERTPGPGGAWLSGVEGHRGRPHRGEGLWRRPTGGDQRHRGGPRPEPAHGSAGALDPTDRSPAYVRGPYHRACTPGSRSTGSPCSTGSPRRTTSPGRVFDATSCRPSRPPCTAT